MAAALALFGASLLTLLALLPVSPSPSFPGGNLVGPVGERLASWLASAFGAGAPLTPLLVGALGWMVLAQSPTAPPWLRPGRWLTVLVGLLVLAPVLARVASSDGESAGWVGSTLGNPLLQAFGWLGAGIVVVLAGAALSQLAFGWDPVTSGAAWGYRRAGPAWRALRRARTSFPDEAADEPASPPARTASPARKVARSAPRESGSPTDGVADAGASNPDGGLPVEELPSDPPAGPAAAAEDAVTPPAALLPEAASATGDPEDKLDEREAKLLNTLRTFKVECRAGKRETGPSVTQFRVIPNKGVKVARIVNLAPDLALAVKAESLRIVAPIPGEGAVGIEVPNSRRSLVAVGDVIRDEAFGRARGRLPLALGKDIRGRPYVADLTRMPHLLVAGQTGSGKSVCINTVVTSLIYRHSPETLRLLMIDPKMVELSIYDRLPHLRHPVVTDPRDAAAVLEWAVMEMERRYELLKVNSARSLTEFNRRVEREEPLVAAGSSEEEAQEYSDGVLPYIVVVVDELADLMMTVQSDVERPLTQLAQKARAIGIHLIVATQRPSVNVITGLIKANFPTRLAFRVASKTDSRTILDMNGAEALLGNGDMLFLPPGEGDPVRLQGAYISTADTERLMQWYAELADTGAEGYEAAPEESDILEEVRLAAETSDDGGAEAPADRDPLFGEAGELCISNGSASTSLLQRRLKIGYGRAARIIDQLHDAGVVGEADGARGREVLVGSEGLRTMLGSDR